MRRVFAVVARQNRYVLFDSALLPAIAHVLARVVRLGILRDVKRAGRRGDEVRPGVDGARDVRRV